MTIEFELEEFPVCNYSLQLNSIEQIEKVLAKMKPRPQSMPNTYHFGTKMMEMCEEHNYFNFVFF
jgi:hypothetical protein